MLTTILLPLFITCNTLQVPAPAVFHIAGNTKSYIALGRREAPGPDHGDDPHDENHDGDLPANAHKWDGHPSGDPYNGSTKNGKSPWQDPPGS